MLCAIAAAGVFAASAVTLKMRSAADAVQGLRAHVACHTVALPTALAGSASGMPVERLRQ